MKSVTLTKRCLFEEKAYGPGENVIVPDGFNLSEEEENTAKDADGPETLAPTAHIPDLGPSLRDVSSTSKASSTFAPAPSNAVDVASPSR